MKWLFRVEYDPKTNNFKRVPWKPPSPKKKKTWKQRIEEHFKKMENQAKKNLAPGGKWYISPSNR